MRRNIPEALGRLEGGLVVSCQAPAGDPLRGPVMMAAMARVVVAGGAVGIRADGPADVAAIRAAVPVPIVGLYKVDLANSPVRITPRLDLALEIARAGADIIAIDATARTRPEPLSALIAGIHDRAGLPVLADVSSLEEGEAAAAAGADAVSTTMSGYAERAPAGSGPDLDLVEQLAGRLAIPVLAEGRISTPAEARTALELGAFAIVVGAAITRPEAITRSFATAVSLATSRGSRVGTFAAGASSALALAIDVGGTKISAAVVDSSGALVKMASVATPSADGAAVIEAAVRLGRALVDGVAPLRPIALGVATAGEVDPATGCIVSSTTALQHWAGIPLRTRLRDSLGLPTIVENDGNAAAIAETRIGAGRGARSVLVAVIGTGIGGGLVLDGRIQRGAHGVAGGVGHLVARPGGRRCGCGARGCIEAYASGPAIAKAFVAAARRADGGRPFLGAAGGASLQDVAAFAVSSHEPAAALARRAIDEAARDLGTVLGGLVNVLDPAVVVLGGGVVAGLGDPFVAAVRSALQAKVLAPAGHVRVMPAALGPFAAVIGAGLLALGECAAAEDASVVAGASRARVGNAETAVSDDRRGGTRGGTGGATRADGV